MSARTTADGPVKSRGGVEKAWASGRVLTAEQRARKQDADRKANRFLKKEVQDRLALLEEKVMQLESAASSHECNPNAGAVASSGANSGAGVVVQPRSSPPFSATLASNSDKDLQWDDTSPGSTDTFECSQVGLSRGEVLLEDFAHNNTNGMTSADAPFILPRNSHGALGSVTQSIPSSRSARRSSRSSPEGRDLTDFLNNLVKHIRSMSPAMVCFDDRFNQDVIVTAVLKGWGSLSRYQRQCPLWAVLRMVDQSLFRDCNLVERVSVLRMLHKRYLSELNVHVPVEGPLPPWFTPQPSAALIIHEPVVDHLTWPRLRERLMPHGEVLNNKFWRAFAKNLRVSWQREPLDTICFSPETSLYHLAPDFESSLFDIRNWRMDTSFFQDFPGLASDIPPDSYMPMRTIAPKFGLPTLEDDEKGAHQKAQQRDATDHGNSLQRLVNHQGQSVMYEPIRHSFQPVMWNGNEFYG